MPKKDVLTAISRATFIILWYKVLKEKREEGMRDEIRSPYEM